ncbi:MAG: hypothetical protein HXY19_00035 [Thermoanaerobaculaceae bacterium]|jgi:hypothetical protein|nr:hypothetical protein [Thermoanaerobaculaceae bacterium]
MVWLALFLSGVLPLGLWPESSGAPEQVVEGVEVYTVEPAEEYGIVAVAPLLPPLEPDDARRLAQLATLAQRLEADAILLLGELAPEGIPQDPEEPLPATDRYAAAAFLVFAAAPEEPTSLLVEARHRTRAAPRSHAARPVPARSRAALPSQSRAKARFTAGSNGSPATLRPPAGGR